MLQIFGLDDNKKIGMLMIGLAALFQTLGVMLFFKRSLILIANVLFIAGLYFFVGLSGIISFFTRKGKIKGSIIYFCGFILIVIGMQFLGTLVQIIGFLIIFRQFLPDFYDYICKIPVVGRYLSAYFTNIQKVTQYKTHWIRQQVIKEVVFEQMKMKILLY